MIITGLLLNVTERNVVDNNNKPKCIYNVQILDNDDPQGMPIKVSLDSFDQADKMRHQLRKEITICAYATSWNYEGKKGVTFKYVPIVQQAKLGA